MVLGKKVEIFDWEWGQNSAPREGQKMPGTFISVNMVTLKQHYNISSHVTMSHSRS